MYGPASIQGQIEKIAWELPMDVQVRGVMLCFGTEAVGDAVSEQAREGIEELFSLNQLHSPQACVFSTVDVTAVLRPYRSLYLRTSKASGDLSDGIQLAANLST